MSWEAYAVRFAHFAGPRRVENFLGGDPHDGPMPFDYFVFALRSGERAIVIDTGFDAATAAKRGRTHLRCPSEGLAAIGIDAGRVEDVVLTHLHYDHCGNQRLFPAARFHLHEAEMAYATGRCMTHGLLRVGYDPDDIAATVRRLFEDRLVFHAGDAEIAPGVTLHHVGGHTRGQMVVRAETASGPLVIASDAVHFHENLTRHLPFPGIVDVAATLDGFRRARALAGGEADRVIPGHDPGTIARFPAAGPGLEGVVARLDAVPRALA
jgi:glyoxylase-like metal-dependent hydrolase (beta-lactamase superfamily II)